MSPQHHVPETRQSRAQDSASSRNFINYNNSRCQYWLHNVRTVRNMSEFQINPTPTRIYFLSTTLSSASLAIVLRDNAPSTLDGRPAGVPDSLCEARPSGEPGGGGDPAPLFRLFKLFTIFDTFPAPAGRGPRVSLVFRNPPEPARLILVRPVPRI